jgi:hypothetical protein
MSGQILSLLLSLTGLLRPQANKEPSIDRFYAHKRPGRRLAAGTIKHRQPLQEMTSIVQLERACKERALVKAI